jgi:UDP-N-acetylmuramyl pentapeptide phosphotransferase/UDP-N-acetylglucosamine-1-phosphate transferase
MMLAQIFFATALVSALLVVTQRWHGRFSLDSVDGIQKLHTHPTPRIGGVAIVAGLLAAWALAAPDVRDILGPMALASVPAFAFGLAEDITKKIGVLPRLLATMLSGAIAWCLTDVAMQNTGIPPLDWLLRLTPIAVLFTAFAVGGVANAVNIIDGFNGLASGTVAILLSALGLIALEVGDTPLFVASLALACIALGFGALNWPLGKIFLGDGGAYLLGFLLAWVAVLLPMRNPQINAWATLLVCAYPVLEVGFSVVRRHQRTGHHPGAPDNVHLHHLLHRRVVRHALPGLGARLQNGLTSPLCWLCAAAPAAWALAFATHTPLLMAGCMVFTMAYAVVYARLSQFRWFWSAAKSTS